MRSCFLARRVNFVGGGPGPAAGFFWLLGGQEFRGTGFSDRKGL